MAEMMPTRMLPATARRDAAAEMEAEMEDPRSQTDAGEVLVPASMLPKGCKAGETVCVMAQVGKVGGSKVGLTPLSIEKEGGYEEEPSEEEDSEPMPGKE